MANLDIPFKCLTLNVQGMRNPKKRRALFRQFNLQNINIIALQETYLLDEDIEVIEKEWQGTFHLSQGTKRSKGLLTLFDKSFSNSNINILDKSDRILTSAITMNDETIIISNIYSPSDNIDNKITFLKSLRNNIAALLIRKDIKTDNLILLGDFNTCLNNNIDIVSGNPHPDRLVTAFNDVVNDLNMNDIFRIKHPTQKTYTWSRKKLNQPMICRRLDYLFISDALIPYAFNVEIKNLGFSDHRAVILHADFATFKRGPSNYKMNKELLKDIDFVNMIKLEIQKTTALGQVLNPCLLWECIKAQIRSVSKVYSKGIARCKAGKKHQLLNELNTLETQLSNGPTSRHLEEQIMKTKSALEIFTLNETRGAQIRAGIKFAELGEKCNKFFLNLEKNRSASNTIFKLNNGDTIINSCDDILAFIMNHYETIYKNPPLINHVPETNYTNVFLNQSNVNTLNENEKEDMDTLITSNEILATLKRMKNDSAPGLDGLPVEVYKVFWTDIEPILTKVFNYSYDSGSLAPSQSQALLCLIHKGGSSAREDISSWRPIALLNADYKILAKLLALRLQKVLTKLIDPNQCAFVKGRGISYMLREVYDLIEREKNKESQSILLSIDYSKAFDTLSTDAIIKALHLYGFGDYFIRWITILLKDRQCSVRNGGYMSSSFVMERGVRQGCPISPILFILTSELFAASIRCDPNIKGIKTPFSHRPIKIRQYADDTTLFLKDFFDFREILSKIKLFAEFSGLELNKKKTYAIRFGGEDIDGTFINGIKFVTKVKILGIYFSSKEDARFIDENYSGKIKILEKVCQTWSRRHLSFIGKITILKAFGISQFVHIIQSIGINTEQINIINKILFKFIWKRNHTNTRVVERVKRNTMCNSYQEGGLCMINLECFQNSFFLSWAERLLNTDEEDWKAVALDAFKMVGGRAVFRSSVLSKDFKGFNLVKNSFWKKVLSVWLDHNINHTDKVYPESPLFNNNMIRFKHATLFFPQCTLNNIICIKDMVTNNAIISYDTFRLLVDSPNSMLMYNCIYNALSHIRGKIVNNNVYLRHEFIAVFCDENVGNIGRNKFYTMLNKTEFLTIECYWSRKLEVCFLKQYWMAAFDSTIETRLQILHWKILMNIYPTSIILSKMKIRNSDLCEHCRVRDTLEHFFFHCALLDKLWSDVDNMITAVAGQRIDLSWDKALFGVLAPRDINRNNVRKINLIILLAKLAVSKSKYGSGLEPSLIFENELRLRNITS